jgi:uncharacterized membrane protein
MQALFFAKLYLLTVPVFFAIDLLWLGVVAKTFYRDNLAHVLSPTVNWPAALSFYLIYIAGILYFAVAPALAQDSLAVPCSTVHSSASSPTSPTSSPTWPRSRTGPSRS